MSVAAKGLLSKIQVIFMGGRGFQEVDQAFFLRERKIFEN